MRGIALTGSRGGTGEEEKGKDNPSYFISVDGHRESGPLVQMAVQRPIAVWNMSDEFIIKTWGWVSSYSSLLILRLGS